jgi:hypothetical protein
MTNSSKTFEVNATVASLVIFACSEPGTSGSEATLPPFLDARIAALVANVSSSTPPTVTLELGAFVEAAAQSSGVMASAVFSPTFEVGAASVMNRNYSKNLDISTTSTAMGASLVVIVSVVGCVVAAILAIGVVIVLVLRRRGQSPKTVQSDSTGHDSRDVGERFQSGANPMLSAGLAWSRGGATAPRLQGAAIAGTLNPAVRTGLRRARESAATEADRIGQQRRAGFVSRRVPSRPRVSRATSASGQIADRSAVDLEDPESEQSPEIGNPIHRLRESSSTGGASPSRIRAGEASGAALAALVARNSSRRVRSTSLGSRRSRTHVTARVREKRAAAAGLAGSAARGAAAETDPGDC